MKPKLSSFLQTRWNVILYQTLGWKIAFWYLILLGRIYFYLYPEEKEKIEDALETAVLPSRWSFERSEIKKKVFRGILAHYYEKLFNAYENIEDLKRFFNERIEAECLHRLDTALDKGNGVLFVTAHYGGVEYIPIFLAYKGYPISVIARFATAQLRETLHRRTKPFGLKIIDADEEKNVMGCVLRELGANRIVFTECDEIKQWRPSRSEKMVFLNKRIGVDRTLNILHKRSGAQVLFGVLHRFNLAHYRLILEDPQERKLLLQQSASSLAGVVLALLEQYIYSYPEEWYQWKNYAVILEDPAPREAVRERKRVGSKIPLEPGGLHAARPVRFPGPVPEAWSPSQLYGRTS